VSNRSGSNPFFNLSQDYDLPLEVVYCCAERIRKMKALGWPSVTDQKDYWGDWASTRAIRIMNDRGDHRFGSFHGDLLRLIAPEQIRN